MSNRKGFSLIEVLLVVLIMGILATLSAPNIKAARIKALFPQVSRDVRQIEIAFRLAVEEYGWDGIPTGDFVRLEDLSSSYLSVLSNYDMPQENPHFRYELVKSAFFRIIVYPLDDEPGDKMLIWRIFFQNGIVNWSYMAEGGEQTHPWAKYARSYFVN